jgi:hypothetical protein
MHGAGSVDITVKDLLSLTVWRPSQPAAIQTIQLRPSESVLEL